MEQFRKLWSEFVQVFHICIRSVAGIAFTASRTDSAEGGEQKLWS